MGLSGMGIARFAQASNLASSQLGFPVPLLLLARPSPAYGSSVRCALNNLKRKRKVSLRLLSDYTPRMLENEATKTVC